MCPFRSRAEGLDLRQLAEKEGVLYLLEPQDSQPKEVEEKGKDPRARGSGRTSARMKQAREKGEAGKTVIPGEIDWEKVTPEERASWKETHAADEKDKNEAIRAHHHGYAIYPVGRDRTFRRYWVFQSVPGLFIEDQEEYVPGDYLQPAPQSGKPSWFDSENLPLMGYTQNGEEKSTSSDKENDIRDNSHRMPNGANAIVDGSNPFNSSDLNSNTKDISGGAGKLSDGNSMEVDEKSLVLTESVHEQISRWGTAPWSFYSTPAQLDKLIESLNPRGIREGPLRTALIEQRDFIFESLKNCPVHLLQNANTDNSANNGTKGVKYQSVKSRNRVTQGAVQNSSAQELLELNLREMLLDLEERIYAGSLGAVKVSRYIMIHLTLSGQKSDEL